MCPLDRDQIKIQELLVFLDKEPKVKYKNVPLNDLFEYKNGNATYTKTWCQKHQGAIPLYSANTRGVYQYIDAADFDGEYLSWAKDGLAGYISYHKEKFSITGHRAILIPTIKCKNIDLLYIKYLLEPILRKNAKGRLGLYGKNEYTTLNCTMIRKLNIIIPVPITDDGSYDIEKQKEIADRYRQIDKIKEGLINKINNLISVNVTPENFDD